MARAIRATPLLGGTVVAAGCYHYVPADPAGVSQGTPLRATLSRPSNFELPEAMVYNIHRVDGELVRNDADGLVLSALWLDAATGQGYPGRGWTVQVPVSDVSSLEVRRLSRWRTAGFVAVILSATYLGFDALRGSADGGGGGGPGGQPR